MKNRTTLLNLSTLVAISVLPIACSSGEEEAPNPHVDNSSVGGALGTGGESDTLSAGGAVGAGGASLSSGGSAAMGGAISSGGSTISVGGSSASGGQADQQTGGAGGDAGSGGAVQLGSGGSPDGSGGLSTDPCATATICDDFESGLDAAWEIQKDSVPAPVVDSTKAVSGTSSLLVNGTTQQSFVALPVPGQKFYARAYMNFEMNTTDISAHGWYIVAADNVTSGDESQIRFGSSSNHGHPELDMNVYAPTCGGEKTQFSDGASDGGAGWNGETTESVNFTAGQWYCVEVLFDGPSHNAQVWVDDQELPGLNVTEASMCTGWAPTFTHIKIGAGASGTVGNIWYDDIVVSADRIGCN